jgi:hypothetical protein
MSDNSTDTSTDGDINSLPQWARDAISRANNEAAERRVKIRQLEQANTDLNNQLASALDAKAAAETAGTTTNLALQKVLIALDLVIVSGASQRAYRDRLRTS